MLFERARWARPPHSPPSSPAQAGDQYSETAVIEPRSCGVLDLPAFAGNDSVLSNQFGIRCIAQILLPSRSRK
jgi:hypothetical protein